MVESYFQGFQYEAPMESGDTPKMFPQEEVYLKHIAGKVTLEDNS